MSENLCAEVFRSLAKTHLWAAFAALCAVVSTILNQPQPVYALLALLILVNLASANDCRASARIFKDCTT